MLSIPILPAPMRRPLSGRAALWRTVAATVLGSLIALPLPPAAAQTRETDRKQAQVQPSAKPAATKTADRKAADAKTAAAKPPAGDVKGPALQLGLFPRESDARWAWETLQRRQPELTKGLSATVSFLDGKTEAGGAVLRATVTDGSDAQRLCRRIVGAGFGCLLIDQPPATASAPAATAAATASIAASIAQDGVQAKPPVVTAAPATPAAAPLTTVTVPVAPPPAPAVAAAPAADPAPSSVLTPIASAAAAPLVPPASVARAVAPTEGTVIYTEEDARTMADIEQHSRRKGRLRSVMPDSRLDVMPATLKLEAWNLCALTFDDGPHRTVTRQVLDVLNREGVRATYFPVGKIAQNQGDLIRDFIAGGHEIGNHSLTHSDLRAMDAEGQRYEIAETNRILREFGANPVLFRPPYGRYSDELLAIARDERMGSVLWTVDTRDWKVRNADKIVQHIKTAGGTGNVFLMHSTYPTTAQALPRVIAELRAKGCEFVTLSEWLERMRTLALPKIVNAGMPTPPAAPPPATPVAVTRN
ncbi:polysaccharide deacetylase family protein [Azospirillum agricola]|uniref:polysaccharide deacetylase family protein n=1 Tax=Azospirillum agricola TaxID=1720247 RepID=UPI000A0F275D|nr:polysaccharide deacetylase family protein [Azospirillum agricola]SMH58470.1 Peptidoglycan/xylan/chitin deacetylase, PgdA/CDA1 family [Azospirillum lipoferum]